ncbi:hypothetical protein NERG_01057 [Nematocida ausubeli]|uniref:Uncharacterized protein n=1 Tax=Nematocida ausubeli (strain ATCC PRA-371 / ERTm2) TaxID=1913371 RepID=H8ZAJ3_NEMA1|nr:hypothetical protein NERG_01057 [Nematocida ausubeli]
MGRKTRTLRALATIRLICAGFLGFGLYLETGVCSKYTDINFKEKLQTREQNANILHRKYLSELDKFKSKRHAVDLAWDEYEIKYRDAANVYAERKIGIDAHAERWRNAKMGSPILASIYCELVCIDKKEHTSHIDIEDCDYLGCIWANSSEVNELEKAAHCLDVLLNKKKVDCAIESTKVSRVSYIAYISQKLEAQKAYSSKIKQEYIASKDILDSSLKLLRLEDLFERIKNKSIFGTVAEIINVCLSAEGHSLKKAEAHLQAMECLNSLTFWINSLNDLQELCILKTDMLKSAYLAYHVAANLCEEQNALVEKADEAYKMAKGHLRV